MVTGRGGWRSVLAIAVLTTGLGCSLWAPPRTVAVVPAAPPLPDDIDHLAWAVSEPYFIVVRKQCRTLDVYRYGERTASFPAVFGLGNPGRKLHEGDRMTPSGLYSIVAKRRHPRWQHFMLLDYPNLEDRERYQLASAHGELPHRGRAGVPGLGGLVGIHGTDKPDLNQRGYDWTFGCVSLQRDDIRTLDAMVPAGTLVLIQE